MENTRWYERGDPALFAAIARVWDFAPMERTLAEITRPTRAMKGAR